MTTVGIGKVVVLEVLVDVLVDDVTVFTGVGGSNVSKGRITMGFPMMITSPNVLGGTDVDVDEDDEDDDDDATVEEVVEVVEELDGVVSFVEEIVESVSPPSIVTMGDAGVSSN
jgi:hypothetical protein